MKFKLYTHEHKTQNKTFAFKNKLLTIQSLQTFQFNVTLQKPCIALIFHVSMRYLRLKIPFRVDVLCFTLNFVECFIKQRKLTHMRNV